MPVEERPLGLGIVGLGRFGAFSLAAYAAMEELEIVAVCDGDRERAQALAPPGARVYEAFAPLLEDPKVAVVVIATPPYLHAPMAIQALRAGKHVVVEKPLALSWEEAQAVVETAQERGVLLTVDHVLRFHPLHQLVSRWVRDRVFGDVELVSLVNLATNEGLDPSHWFWDPQKSGGILVEHGVHFFDLCNQWVGAPPSAVQGHAFLGAHGRVDRVAAVLRYGQEVFASFYHSFDRPRCVERTTLHLGLSRGEMILDGWIPVRLTVEGLVAPTDLDAWPKGERAPEVLGSQGPWIHVRAELTRPARQDEYRRALQALMRDFVQAIRARRAPAVTPEDALASLAVALQAQKTMGPGS